MSSRIDELNLGEYRRHVDGRLERWKDSNFNRRLWEKDPTLWFREPVPEITNRLGWLDLPEMMRDQLNPLVSFADEVKNEGMRHVILLGMGGSSLAPEVYQRTFGNKSGYPELKVLDSTHPDALKAIEEGIDLRQTLFIVASKSGTTIETLAFFKYFWEKVAKADDNPGRYFIAITDPDTPLVKLAEEKGFRRVFLAPPNLGGRYSALTVFGLVPAALIGADVHRLLDAARVAAEGCAAPVPGERTPGLILGAALGELAARGRSKVTFLTSPSLKSFPDWLEQLIAESTGKGGKGILPVANETPGNADAYGNDRFFVYFYLEGDSGGVEEKVKELEAARHPVARICLAEKYDIGREIFRWEIAVAAAGSILDIHPFNQPDVELAKELARQAANKGDGNAEKVETLQADGPELANAMESWLGQAKEGDYIALQAYLNPSAEATKLLSKARSEILNNRRLATTSGYGPRFLHSTGQLHKGGPKSGLFLQLVDEPARDLPVPDADYTFGEIIAAQAIGDFQALKSRDRPVLRINLGKDPIAGLSRIVEVLSIMRKVY